MIGRLRSDTSQQLSRILEQIWKLLTDIFTFSVNCTSFSFLSSSSSSSSPLCTVFILISQRRNYVPREHSDAASLLLYRERESYGTQWRTGGEVKGKYANVVGSQHSCTVSEDGLSSITTADAHASAASSRPNWNPRRFKWNRPFRCKTKSGFCACAITFRTSSTIHGAYTVSFSVESIVFLHLYLTKYVRSAQYGCFL